MDRKSMEAEVLNELSRMEQDIPEAKDEPKVVEQIEESEGDNEVSDNKNDSDDESNSSQNQDVEKSDGKKQKKSGVQSRIDKLTRSMKEAQERAEKLEAELKAEREAKEAKHEDSDSEIELEPSHSAFLTKKIREEAERILAEREQKQKELALKQQQEEMIETFKSTVMNDYADSFDTSSNSFNDDAADQILSLTELISSNPSFYMPKLEKFGAKKLYKRYIADEDIVVAPRKQMPATIQSQSKPTTKPLDPTLSRRDYRAEMERQILAELN